MDATQVVIHFIGLVLFTTRVENDPGLHAILPAIHARHRPEVLDRPPIHHLRLAPAGISGGSPRVAPMASLPTVEPHVALLVFPGDMVVNDSQWTASTVVSRFRDASELASYKYVELTGEHITFVVDAPNGTPTALPVNMPQLPMCGTTGELTSGFQFPYSQAAAVVDIPEGILAACRRGTSTDARIDTRLTLNTTGTLTIVATNAGIVKTLVLNTTGNRKIFLANVPPPGANGLAPAGTRSGHYLAYYKMIGQETSTCAGPPSSGARELDMPDCGMTPFPSADRPTAAANGLVARLRRIRALFQIAGTGARHEPPPGSIPSVNAECSNTQWP